MENMQIRQGDRVEHVKNHKTGTAIRDQHDSGDRGFGVYVKWDNAKSRFSNPVNTKNLRKI